MELLCAEGSAGCRTAFKDPVYLKDIRIVNNLMKVEKHYLIPVGHMDQQEDVLPYMRRIVTKWMLEVCQEQCCEEEVFSLAVSFVDRFLYVTNNLSRRHFQLLASACVFIASKLKETFPIPAHKIVIYTDYSISHEQLLDWEVLILSKLKFDIGSVIPLDYLDIILDKLGLTAEMTTRIRKHTLPFITHFPIDELSVAYPPSLVASACICAGIQTLTDSSWRADVYASIIKDIIQIDIDSLRTCKDYILQSAKGDEASQPSSKTVVPSTPPHSATPTDMLNVEV